MKAALAHQQAIASPVAKSVLWPATLAIVTLSLIWFEVMRHLQSEWSYNPQYSYGWSVPFLVLYMVWRRWSSRPEPLRTVRERGATLLLVAGTFVLLAVRFVAEANPDWRFLSWTFALTAVALTLTIFYLCGGKSWARYFAFPALFSLVAVPWPTALEQFVTQNLMHAVTAINVFGLNLVGVPALQQGNVIEVGAGLIGIEEACSGVRSLQATLMISLFLGELYSFNAARRMLLVLLGAVLAFLCNLVRTAILVWVGAHEGTAAIHGWHDPAGFTILVVCLAGLWVLSLALRRGEMPNEPFQPDQARRSLQWPTAAMASVAVCLLLGEAGVQIWYRAHDSSMADSHWSVCWPTDQPAYQHLAIAPETEGILRYNEGGGARWKDADDRQWLLYFFQWLPGQTAARFVKIHRPDICLPATGLTMVGDQGLRLLEVNGVKLPVRSYRFDNQGTPLHVFYCYWDARSIYDNTRTAVEEDWTPWGRVRAALRGRREMGARMMELVVSGYDNDSEANAALQREVSKIVVRG